MLFDPHGLYDNDSTPCSQAAFKPSSKSLSVSWQFQIWSAFLSHLKSSDQHLCSVEVRWILEGLLEEVLGAGGFSSAGGAE